MKFIKKIIKYFIYFTIFSVVASSVYFLLFGPSTEEIEAQIIADEKAKIEASNKLKESFLNDGMPS